MSSEVITRFHGKAQTVRDGIAQDFATVFRDVDVLLTPSGALRAACPSSCC